MRHFRISQVGHFMGAFTNQAPISATLALFIILAVLSSKSYAADSSGAGVYSTISDPNMVSIFPVEYPDGIPNALKGFFSYMGLEKNHHYSTMSFWYTGWSDLENAESDGIQKIIDYSNAKWGNYPASGIRVVAHVYLQWSRTTSTAYKEYWPADMTEGDYTSAQFKTRVQRLISRMGQVWNNDPRIAFVDVAMVGAWGEHNSPEPTAEIQQVLGDAYTAAFPNKIVSVRYPWKMFTTHTDLGCSWDSFAHWDQIQWGEYRGILKTGSRWKTKVVGGEVAYGYGNVAIQPGSSPTASVSDPIHRNFLVNVIRGIHATHMRWISRYDQNSATARAGASELQKTMGYRFLIKRAAYTKRVEPGGELRVLFNVVNSGAAPFYYDWPVEVSLLNPTTHQPVWKNTLPGVDIRKWLPGDQWDWEPRNPDDANWNVPSTHKYLIPAQTYEVDRKVLLPGSAQLPKGEYILALSINDPYGGNVPNARFAVKNYFSGGRHPIGKIGVGVDVSGGYELASSSFADPDAEKLPYSLVTQADKTAPSTPAFLKATKASSTQVDLAWTASSDNIGVKNYRVYRDGKYLADAAFTSYSDTGLADVTAHTYTVSAQDAAGNESAKSQQASTTTATTPAPDTQAPTIPSGLTASAASTSQINLSWSSSSDNTGVTEYWIYRGGSYLAKTTSRSYSDTGLAAGTTYTYAVSARDAAGNESAQSEPASAATITLAAPTDTKAPTVPANLSATAVSASQINLSWSASTDDTGVTGYKVYRGSTVVGTPTSTSYVDTGLAGASSYSYKVSALDGSGNESSKSTSATATTQDSAAGVADYAEFDGSGNYVDAGTMELANSSFSISGWIQPSTNPPTQQTWFAAHSASAKQQSLHLRIFDTGVARFGYYGNDLDTAANVITFGIWNYVAYTYNAATDTSTIYVNGVAVASGNQGPFLGASPQVYIGHWGATEWPAEDFIGSIDEVQVFNKALTAGEVASIYASGRTSYQGDTSNVVISYDFDTGGTVEDTQAPTTPGNLKATAVSTSQINLSWTASTDNTSVSEYIVSRNGSDVKTTTSTSYSDGGLSDQTVYTYKVRARDEAGNESAESAAASATTWSATPMLPTGVHVESYTE